MFQIYKQGVSFSVLEFLVINRMRYKHIWHKNSVSFISHRVKCFTMFQFIGAYDEHASFSASSTVYDWKWDWWNVVYVQTGCVMNEDLKPCAAVAIAIVVVSIFTQAFFTFYFNFFLFFFISIMCLSLASQRKGNQK